MEAVSSSETALYLHWTTWDDIPECIFYQIL